MRVIIMRGVPGSGKSTWAGRQVAHARGAGQRVWVCSADDYFVGNDGVYRFDPELVGRAHTECLRNFLQALTGTRPDLLIVDNTNTQAWEIAPYYRLAEVRGCEVEIVQVVCDPAVAVRRQTHGVPDAKWWQMYQNMLTERLPAHWRLKLVSGEGQP